MTYQPGKDLCHRKDVNFDGNIIEAASLTILMLIGEYPSDIEPQYTP